MIFFLVKLFTGFLVCFGAMTFAGNRPAYLPEYCSRDTQYLRTAVRHIEAGGIGYNKGYTTFDAFLALNPETCTLMPFVDLRGHVFDNGKGAANVGFGLRQIIGSKIYGINAYYDYRNGKKLHYNQVGFGFEIIGTRFDMRINGYLPVGKKIIALDQMKFVGFAGHHMMLSQRSQFAMKGVNGELGVHFGKSRFFDFYAAAGPYCFIAEVGPKLWGGKGRLVCTFNERWTFELSNSYDRMFHNRFQCQLTFSLPFGGGSNGDDEKACPNLLSSRMVQRVERQEIIVEACGIKRTPAINSTTGQPFNFVFVDNTSHSNGTYESPYPTLALAQANSNIGDIIYVFPGDGTTRGMDAGIILQQNQNFWGSALNYTLQTAQGIFIIPAQSSIAPKITNTFGNVITLASVNQVRGFVIQNADDNGIFAANAQNIEISDCMVTNSRSDQIHLEYRGGPARGVFNNLVLKNGSQKGLFVDSTAFSTLCTVSNCIIQDNADVSIDAAFAQEAAFALTNSMIDRNGNSNVFNFSGPSTLLVSGCSFNANTSINIAPITFVAAANRFSAAIEKNTFSDNICGAVHAVLNNTDSELNIAENIIIRNGTGSIGPFGAALFIDPTGTDSGNCSVNLTKNTLLGNGGSVFYCANGNYHNFNVNAVQNTISGNGGAGFVFANACDAFTLVAQNNSISNGNDHGIATGGVMMTSVDMTISRNQITGNVNSASGIALSHEGTGLNLIATDNIISDNEGSGIVMYSANVIENVTARVANNTINNNQNVSSNATGGIDLEQFNNLSCSLVNNTLSNNVGAGAYIGSTAIAPFACVDMTGNVSDTGYTLSNSSGTFNLTPCDVATSNSGVITTIGVVTTVQLCPDGAPCPP